MLAQLQPGQLCTQEERDETETINEQSTLSLGRLVHEMVTIYGLCGDTLKVLLDSNPDAAGCVDSLGRLPLHLAVDRKKPWIGLLDEQRDDGHDADDHDDDDLTISG